MIASHEVGKLARTMIFPTEIWHLIFPNLNQHSLAQCAQVSRQLNQITIPYLYISPSLPTFQRFHTFKDRLTANNAALVEVLDLSNTGHRWERISQEELIHVVSKCPEIGHLDLDLCTLL
jgi:hypothetical protein